MRQNQSSHWQAALLTRDVGRNPHRQFANNIRPLSDGWQPSSWLPCEVIDCMDGMIRTLLAEIRYKASYMRVTRRLRLIAQRAIVSRRNVCPLRDRPALSYPAWH